MPENSAIMNVLIVDDEKKACTNLTNMLIDYVDSSINIMATANNTQEAEALIRKHKPDAIFLDIEMPNENAFQFLDRITPFDFEVVFVTAYDEYAIRAFRLNAIDYILKPISISELKNAVQKLKQKISYKKIIANSHLPYTEVSEQLITKSRQKKITLKDNSNTVVVDFKDIYYVEAQGSYSKVVYSANDKMSEMMLSNPLSDYEELLPSDIFYRAHRSYLINCMHVKKISTDETHFVIMKNSIQLPVSRRRFSLLVEFLKSEACHE